MNTTSKYLVGFLLVSLYFFYFLLIYMFRNKIIIKKHHQNLNIFLAIFLAIPTSHIFSYITHSKFFIAMSSLESIALDFYYN